MHVKPLYCTSQQNTLIEQSSTRNIDQTSCRKHKYYYTFYAPQQTSGYISILIYYTSNRITADTFKIQ